MHIRLRSYVVVACLLGLAPLLPTSRADSKTTPTFTLRLKSIDGLLGDAEFLAAAAGKENEAAQFGGLFRQQKGPKGLFGIDTSRPLGMYAKLSSELMNSASVIMVPVVDQDALLKQLEMFGIQPKKDADGTYSLPVPGLPVPVFFKFADKYLHVTALTKDALKGEAPAGWAAGAEKSLLSAVWNLDQVPENLKQTMLQQLNAAIAKEKEKPQPGETEAQKKFRLQTMDAIGQQFALVVKEGRRIDAHFNVDQKSKELIADIGFAAAEGSQLAKGIAELGRSQSLFASLTKPDAALTVLMHASLPDSIRQLLGPVIDEEIKKGVDKEQDAGKKALAEQFLNAIKPTLKAGEFDGFVQISPQSEGGKYGVLVALKITEGDKVLEAVRTLVNVLVVAEKGLIEVETEKIGNAGIYRVNAQNKYDAQAKQIFGDNPIYVAVLPQAVLVAAGPKGLESLKTAAGVKAMPAKQFSLSISLRSLAPLLAISDKKNAAFAPAAEKAFGKSKDDTVTVTVEGGKELKARFVVKTPVIVFLAEVGDKSGK